MMTNSNIQISVSFALMSSTASAMQKYHKYIRVPNKELLIYKPKKLVRHDEDLQITLIDAFFLPNHDKLPRSGKQATLSFSTIKMKDLWKTV